MELAKHIDLNYAGAAVSAGSSIDDNSSRFDMANYEGILFFTTITDSVQNGVATLKVEQNTSDADSGMAAISGATATATSAVNDDLNPTGLKKGDYAVSVTDASGCLTAETINLAPSETRKGDCQDFDLYVPNAFSPNGDGFNDLLHIFPESDSNLRRIKSFRLFDRWGALIYQKNNFLPLPDIPLWDGTFNGRPMQPGVFVWLLIAELHDGSEKVLSGDVLLFR